MSKLYSVPLPGSTPGHHARTLRQYPSRSHIMPRKVYRSGRCLLHSRVPCVSNGKVKNHRVAVQWSQNANAVKLTELWNFVRQTILRSRHNSFHQSYHSY